MLIETQSVTSQTVTSQKPKTQKVRSQNKIDQKPQKLTKKSEIKLNKKTKTLNKKSEGKTNKTKNLIKTQILKTQNIRLQRLKPIKKFKIFHLPILITVWVVCISYYAYHHRRIHKPSIKK